MINDLDRVANAMTDTNVTGPILEEGAKIVQRVVRGMIKDYNKPVKRYKNGKVVATYYPGNLRRSVQLLDLKNTPNKFVGYVVQPRGKGRGTFKGENKVDGYYARFVEIKSAPLRRGADAASGQALSVMTARFGEIISRFNASN